MDDILSDINDDNKKRKRKVLIIFDDRLVMLCRIKKLNKF